MTAYSYTPRSRPVGAVLRAKITAVVQADPTLIAKVVAERCGCSRLAVYTVREMLGLRTRKKRWTWRHRVTTKYDAPKDSPRCICGLLKPCTCTGPDRAENHLGRRDEPVIGATGW